MKTHPQETREEARRLLELGLNYREIGERLGGIAPNTISRWFNPELHERMLAAGRRYKATKMKRGTCLDCGCPTSVGGKSKYALRCLQCHNIWQRQRPPTWTPEKIIAAIQRWVDENGKPPTATQWRRRGEYWPAFNSVYGPQSPFKTWRSAIQAAGYDTPAFTHKTPGPGRREWSVEEARRLRDDEGMTNIAVGERFGVSGSAIYQALGPRGIPRPVKRKKKRTREERIEDLRKALAKEKGEHHEGNRHT